MNPRGWQGFPGLRHGIPHDRGPGIAAVPFMPRPGAGPHNPPSATLSGALLAVLFVTLPLQAQAGPAPDRGILREIRIFPDDVFTPEVAGRRPLAALVNALHWQTREDTIRRELWLGPGDLISTTETAEIERNLRALGLFAEVTASLQPTSQAGHVDLEIRTRDRLTLAFSAGASSLGGVTSYRVSAGESNLAGLGDRFSASFTENSESEFRGSIVYSDLHLLDTWHTSTIRATRTENGDTFSFQVARPIKHLADPRGHQVAIAHEETAAEYFRNGERAAKVLFTDQQLDGGFTWVRGPAHDREFLDLFGTLQHREFGEADGFLADGRRIPGDTDIARAGFRLRRQYITGFRKVTNLDTLDFVQDLQLGWSASVGGGLQWRQEQLADDALQPLLSVAANWTMAASDAVYLSIAARQELRWDGPDIVGRDGQVGAFVLAALGAQTTLAGGMTLDAVRERQDLPVELTLGDDNGLRGFGARQLHGAARVRTNLELRHDTGLELATVRLGVVGFADLGWIGELDALGPTQAGAGFGLRLGSRALFGSSVLRIDLAHPLVDVPGEDRKWQLSIAVGQVFTFGGYANQLGGR